MLNRVAFLTLLAAISPSAWAACPNPITNRDLSQDMTRAEKAYSSLDLDGFNTATDALRADLPCSGEPITKDIAARMHRVEGLRSYVDQDRRNATQSFAAARLLEPEYHFPESLVPAGYPELEMYDAIDVSLGSKARVDPMIDGYILFDGRVGLERNTDWPTVVQVVNENGDLVVTAYLRPGQPMPSYYPEAAARTTAATNAPSPDAFKNTGDDDLDPFADVLDDDKGGKPKTGPRELTDGDDDDLPPPPKSVTTPPRSTTSSTTPKSTTVKPPPYNPAATLAPKPPPTPTPRPSSLASSTTTPTRSSAGDDARLNLDNKPKKKPVGLLTVSLVSAAASGVTYALALHAADSYRSPDAALDELDSLRNQANILSGVSAGVGVLAVGTGIAVGVRW